MARRNDHSRPALKDLILDTAWDLLAKDGPSSLTARTIAARIGYAPGSIYNVFADMDDLTLHLNARALDRLYEAIADPALADPNQPLLVNMENMASRYLAFAGEHRPHWLLLFTYTLPEGRVLPEWYKQKIDRLFTPLETLLASAYGHEQAAMATRVLWSAVHGICMLQETGKMSLVSAKPVAQAMVHNLLATYMAGMTAKT